MIEHLEPRQFLDAVIHGHELTITATSGDDVITMPVETVPEFEPNGDIVRVLHTTVMLNGVSQGEFSTRNITRVVVDLRSGNDYFFPGVSRGRKFKVFVIGG